jgi:hypothetical protein
MEEFNGRRCGCRSRDQEEVIYEIYALWVDCPPKAALEERLDIKSCSSCSAAQKEAGFPVLLDPLFYERQVRLKEFVRMELHCEKGDCLVQLD